MGSQHQKLHILFFPFLSPGHMIPTVDMVKLFASRGVKSTIVTTPANAALIQPAIDHANASGRGYPIALSLIRFPADEVGLPVGLENSTQVKTPDAKVKFFKAVNLLRQPFERAVAELRPDAMITDTFLPWTVDVASELGVPRLSFHGTSSFSLCVIDSMFLHRPLEVAPSDAESFVVPGLPHRIEMLKSQEQEPSKRGAWMEMLNRIKESELKSYGAVINSFRELEPEYAKLYRDTIGKAWLIGPVSLCNKTAVEMTERGHEASVDSKECLYWLDGKERSSVVYVCFGSISHFTAPHLREMALGLEASGHPFVWALREENVDGDVWLPEGYEERVVKAGRGFIIKGWAPQILMLNHPAVGGFVTHCGWNSTLESIGAGVPMVTWPLFAEQFYNEKMVVQLLGIGLPVGSKEYRSKEEGRKVIPAEDISRAVSKLMDGGEEAEAMRRRARELAETAAKAVGEGGSSHVAMGDLVEELLHRRSGCGV